MSRPDVGVVTRALGSSVPRRRGDTRRGSRVIVREIAVLVFEGRLISSLREYWASEQIGEVA
jgi:hypothetical protein